VAEIVGFASNGVYVSLADGMGGFLAPMLANGSSFWGAQTGGWSSQDLYTRELADVNNDLIADIVGFASNGVYVSRGDVIGFFAPEFAGAAFWGVQTGNWSSQDTYSRFMADADGDGKPDIVGFAQSGVYVSINTSTLISASFAAPRFVPDSSFWGVQTGGWSSQNLYPHSMADVDGDGKADIVGFAQSGVYVSIISLVNVSFAAATLVPDSSFWGANTGGWSSQDAYPRELANITNGDTKADIVAFAQNGVWTALAGATTFFAPSGSAPESMLDQGTSSGVPASSPDVALLSQYMAGSFATSSDGNSGTLTDAAATTQPAWLTPPHA
jgi:FG-GAP-like repeat